MYTELKYKIAFSLIKNLLGDTALQLLQRIGSVNALFEYTESQLECICGAKPDFFRDDVRQQLLNRAQQEIDFINNHPRLSCSFITDPDYPKRLAFCSDAPSLLYQLGSVNLNADKIVGIVGTRHATPYGVDFTTNLVTELASMFPGIVIVSGLAYGIDVAAHKAAMAANTPTVAVMAHGLDHVYPAEHRTIAKKIVNAQGSLLSEYPSCTKQYRQFFLARNRIVAGLCDCIVVVESDFKGGSMSTARMAREYSREVLALPGRISDMYSRGTNWLIATERARLISSASDLANAMMWQPQQVQPTAAPRLFRALNNDEQIVYDYIIAHPDAIENDICVNLGIPFSKVSSIIFTLEMEDFILKVPGGRYMPSSNR